MRISIIAAMDCSRAIGRNNQLPWRLPDDMARFKALTMGSPVIMGRKTAQSLGRALPGRKNIVLTRSGAAPFKDMVAVGTVDEAIAQAADTEAEEAWVIGGGEIYALFLPLADKMSLTFVKDQIAGADAFFPDFPTEEWAPVSRINHDADARHAHAFCFIDCVRRR